MHVKGMIHRYFVAVHGRSYIYRAPETFDNVLERWMLAVAADNQEVAEEHMRTIEVRMKEDSNGR